MKIADVRVLREELEAVEATMQRIKALWLSEDFPAADCLEDLARAVGNIDGDMNSIIQKVEQLPTADSVEDLGEAVGRISSTINDIIDKAEELPTADDVRG